MKKYNILILTLEMILIVGNLISCTRYKTDWKTDWNEEFILEALSQNNEKNLVKERFGFDLHNYCTDEICQQYREYRDALLRNPEFYEKYADREELWSHYTPYVDGFLESYFVSRTGYTLHGNTRILELYDFSTEEYSSVYETTENRYDQSDYFKELKNNFTPLEEKRWGLYLDTNLEQILYTIVSQDYEDGCKALEEKEFEKASTYLKAAYSNNSDFFTPDKREYLLSLARNYLTNGSKKEMAAALNTIPNQNWLTGTDFYVLAETSSGSDFEISYLYKLAYTHDNLSLTEKQRSIAYEHAVHYDGITEGYKKYGGRWSLIGIQDRVTGYKMNDDDIWPGYLNHMRYMYLNSDGSITTSSAYDGDWKWEIVDNNLRVFHKDSSSGKWTNSGGLNSEGYICCSAGFMRANMSLTIAMFWYQKD